MVMRSALLALGILLVLVEQFVQSISLQAQFVLFILGVAAVGIPHGAADLLVASKNALGKKVFSKRSFHLKYMGKLVFFALLFWLFPVAANLIFIICAVFYFRETILVHFLKVNLVKESFVIFYFLRKDELTFVKSTVKQKSFCSFVSFFGFFYFDLTRPIFLNNHSFID